MQLRFESAEYASKGLPPGTLRLSLNENSLGPSPRVTEAIRQHIEDVNRYSDEKMLDLYRKIADHHDLPHDESIKHPMHPSPNLWVTVGSGASQMLHQIAAAYLGEDVDVVEPEPSYGMISAYAEVYFHSGVHRVPMDDRNHIDIDAMRNMVTTSTRLVVITNPNSPTGTILKSEALQDLLDGLPSGVVVVLDEAYMDYVEDPSCARGESFVKQYDNLIVVRTFSKGYGIAGLRVGYAFGNPALISRIRMYQGGLVSSLGFFAASAAMDDQEHVRKARDTARASRGLIYDACDRLGLQYLESHAPFLLVDVGRDAGDVVHALAKKGIHVSNASTRWGLPTTIRVSTGTEYETELFIAALSSVLSEDEVGQD